MPAYNSTNVPKVGWIMILRFRCASAAYALMLVICYATFARPFGDEMDAFSVLLCMCILACVALWPRSREEAERKATSPGAWAERIKLEPAEPDIAGRQG